MPPIIPNWDDLSNDSLTKFIDKYWSPYKKSNDIFDPNIIETIYNRELRQHNFSPRKIVMLEFSQYLENYLIPNLTPETKNSSHIMSIVWMINQKVKEGVPALKTFESNSDVFAPFFYQFLKLFQQDTLTIQEKIQAIMFLNHTFNSIEIGFVRKCAQKLVSLSTWSCLYENRRETEFEAMPKLKKIYNALMKKEAKMDQDSAERAAFERTFLFKLLQDFTKIINNLAPSSKKTEDGKSEDYNHPSAITYCERFLEFLIDLEAHLPNRRFFKVILDSSHLITYATLSSLNDGSRERTKLFSQLLEILKFYHDFEINDLTGEALTEGEMTDDHYEQILSLQKTCFKEFPSHLLKFALANVASVDTRTQLTKHFKPLNPETLYSIGTALALLPPPQAKETNDSSVLGKWSQDPNFLLELLVSRHQRRSSQLDTINAMPLYPTEDVLWDENQVPDEYYNGESCLALPKLNLQFLTLHDYLLRNFTLFKLETTFEIRKDIEDAITRMKPWRSEDGRSCLFGGWARMATQITSFVIMDVGKPDLGQSRPSRVRADITVNLNVTPEVREEWQSLRRHDICFLICVKPQRPYGTRHDNKKPFKPQVGLTYVRGCEIEGMLDDEGKLIEEGPRAKEHKPPQGNTRTWRVQLDTNQYAADMASSQSAVDARQGGGAHSEAIPFLEAYDGFNVLLRRKPKENNFKAVLQTIRDIMNVPPKWGTVSAQPIAAEPSDHVTTDHVVLPRWLHDLMLGYGEPDSASYGHVTREMALSQPYMVGLDNEGYLDFRDTFLDRDHLISAFPHHSIRFSTPETSLDRPATKDLPINYKIKFNDLPPKDKDVGSDEPKQILVKEYQVEPLGPYFLPIGIKRNQVRFTQTQVGAVKSGLLPGLTMVVGPPGTGKTDLAVQIVSTLYHTHPEQRTLLITHSNQALNQLFEKISRLDIDERHLLRLGHGEEGLDLQGKDFSKYGRVDYVLSRRLTLLSQVRALQLSILREDELAESGGEISKELQLVAEGQEVGGDGAVDLEKSLDSRPEVMDADEAVEEFDEVDEESALEKRQNPADAEECLTLKSAEGTQELTEESAGQFGSGGFGLTRENIIVSALQVENPFSTTPGTSSLGSSYFKSADVSYTCETAHYFYRYEVLSRWERFQVIINVARNKMAVMPDDDVEKGEKQLIEKIVSEFPFTRFFADVGRPLFDEALGYEENMARAESCFKYIKHIFDQLEEFRAFELLRTGTDRVRYLLIREAKIIAMTCTHAALRRGDLIAAGFKYDNVLVEEAAQILEIETFIPLLLQNNEDGVNRLKRWIMIGDHNQLPPVIKNMAFKKYSNMEQSMFTRFIRLGVPAYHLDAQGRAKPSLCRLYNWRYEKLGNLPHTTHDPEYLLSNPGFVFDTQLVNVEDFNGVGESEPSPYFYQNLAEAEFVVATFTYMRLLGYPADKITVLTTYNGQKHLIRDVIRRRCGDNPIIGWPSKITTVDRFQGQQNDYVLLSLVKTRNIGHLRDVRRLVVAMSRARLGLYIFARVNLFRRCFELTPVFKQLMATPVLLNIYPQEIYPGVRPINTQPVGVIPFVIQDMAHMANFVYQFYQDRLRHMQRVAPPTQPITAIVPEVSSNPTPSRQDISKTDAKGTNEIVTPKSPVKMDTTDLKDQILLTEMIPNNPFESSINSPIAPETNLQDEDSQIVENDSSSSEGE